MTPDEPTQAESATKLCCCCSDPRKGQPAGAPHWQTGETEGAAGRVPQVSGRLDARDKLGTMRVRLGIARCCYHIEPGLYAIGAPDADSRVFVTANYKLSFDHLRSALLGRSGWILVLDTDGINVWCAAGKGTFGTDELVQRIRLVDLASVVNHRQLIVPQLGATGVAAHLVAEQSDFNVVYGPVRAADLPAFLDAGCHATPEMRRVRFSLGDRLAVVPTEIVMWGVLVLPLVAVLALLGQRPLADVFLGAFLAGGVLAPLLLPWLPGRSFSVKGAFLGTILGLAAAWATVGAIGATAAAGLFLLTVAVTSFFALNFTGCTTFTSLSGTRHETLRAVPLQLLTSVVALVLWFWSVWF